MQGEFILQKRKLMAAGGSTFMLCNMTNNPLLPDDIRSIIVGTLSILTVGFVGGAMWMHFHQQKIERVTKRYSMHGYDFEDCWKAEYRTDWSDSHICKYKVWYSVSHDEAETFEEGNVTTYTGDKVRVQDGIRTTEICYPWIGEYGKDIDSNIIKNIFAKMIKTRNSNRVSVLHIAYLKQVMI